jgi:large subunit ribosomal protein L4
MKTPVFDKTGKEVGTVQLNDAIFSKETNEHLLWETIVLLQRNQRKGLASAKNKTEVSGGGKKPYRQKGIGWARAGTIRSPIWRGGGVVFGPKPRDYSSRIPKKKKMNALLVSLSAKAKEDRIKIITDFSLETSKTKDFVAILKSIALENVKTLVGVDTVDVNLKRAGQNVPYVLLKRVQDFNCLDILAADYILMTKKGLEKLEQRCATKKS